VSGNIKHGDSVTFGLLHRALAALRPRADASLRDILERDRGPPLRPLACINLRLKLKCTTALRLPKFPRST
jgi:hypothetical protein